MEAEEFICAGILVQVILDSVVYIELCWVKFMKPKAPHIVCLCGSTRFKEAFDLAAAHETLKGHIVVTCGLFGHSDYPSGARHITNDGDPHNERKKMLDELHFSKIDLADEVVVVNWGSYVGQSTVNEIQYAHKIGIPVRMLFS